MCGIVGILGVRPVAPLLVQSLRQMEYRGYDSAGIATLETDDEIDLERAAGKLDNLASSLQARPLQGFVGIGHTRWATHGEATEINAHPHATARVAVVHNGIIENHHQLREKLQAEGAIFLSQTDTEVITHAIDQRLLRQLSPRAAVTETLLELEGAFAIAVLFAGEQDLLIAARRGSPLAIGYGDHEMYIGSDALALAPLTDTVSYLENGDCAVLTRESVTIYAENGKEVARAIKKIPAQSLQIDKGPYKHYMAKEIAEQPEAVSHTLSHHVDFDRLEISDEIEQALVDVDFITMVACGTSHYACDVAQYWFEKIAGVPTKTDIASEFRYRQPPFPRGNITIVVSQSGETADTLASLQYAKEGGQRTIGIVNVAESQIARGVDTFLQTHAGPEKSVASTKAFSCQLAILAAMAIKLGRMKGKISRDQEKDMIRELGSLPRLLNEVLELEGSVHALAERLYSAQATHLLFLGRDTAYPLTKEGALKFTEVTYKLGQGYAAGELKHGPLASVDERLPVIVLAPSDGEIFEKTLSNVEEVKARKGNIFLFTDKAGRKRSKVERHAVLELPASTFITAPFMYVIPLQLLAYHMAVLLGTDVDQPRNLAKSVTVE